ncbi:RNA-directed DNA polymerase, eukaryota [Tanacetum coccineum]|uniref:RNA-directed DNA polymerase, eukaryota n=1 Tax=Tanacetum coccineum TaxID=301880 RepID=A0ABQ4X063_9ASTR
MVSQTWNAIVLDDRNKMVRFKKKLQILKKEIWIWVTEQKQKQLDRIKEISSKLSDIDKVLDQGGANEEILLSRLDLLKQMQDIKSSDAHDFMQKAKIQWAIKGDENYKFFHGIINQKRAYLAIKGVMVDDEWMDDRCRVAELENPISRDEIRNAVWGCGENKSPGPDGFTFEFFRIKIDSSLTISYLFYVDDAVFIGEWSNDNLFGIMHILHCFSLSSGLKINLKKSQLLGVGTSNDSITAAALKLRCSVMKTPFKYLGVMVGVGGRLTLLKSVLGYTPIYHMSLYKVPKSVLHSMESIRRNFFNGTQGDERKITWVKWSKVALSLQRTVRGGVEAHQLDLLQKLIETMILTNLEDRWVWDLNGEGVFRVKDARMLLDECFLPKDSTATRWVKSIPIKINVFAWKVYLDRLPTRLNLMKRGILVPSLLCPVCNADHEDMSHLLFSCSLANEVVRLVCRWWNLTWSPLVQRPYPRHPNLQGQQLQADPIDYHHLHLLDDSLDSQNLYVIAYLGTDRGSQAILPLMYTRIDNSRALQQNGKDKVVISKALISSPSSKATWRESTME